MVNLFFDVSESTRNSGGEGLPLLAEGLRNPGAQRSRDPPPDGRRSHVSGGEDLAFGDPPVDSVGWELLGHGFSKAVG